MKKTKCVDCHLIFREGQTICPRCGRMTETLAAMNCPRVTDPVYFYYNPEGPDWEQYPDLPYSEEDLQKDMLDDLFC